MTAQQKKPIRFRWVAGIVVFALILWGGDVLIDWLWSLHGEELVDVRNRFIILGGTVGIIVATWRNIVSQIQANAAQKQALVAHRSQTSDQWTRAMDLLTRAGKDNKPLMEARIGGMNSLEFLANIAPEDYGVLVMQNIVTYIRENARKTAGDMPEMTGSIWKDSFRFRALSDDVRLAFAVLKRLYDRHASTPKQRKTINLVRFFDDNDYAPRLSFVSTRKPIRDDLDFSHADFRELDFGGVKWIDKPCCSRTNFQNANLWGTNLAGAHLEQVLLQETGAGNIDMRGASLWGAQLQKTVLVRADLRGTHLADANLQGTDLAKANLQGSYLRSAELQGANLSRAKLQGADLRGAKLQGVDLQDAQLQGTDLDNAELNFSVWHKVQFDTDKKLLKISLKDAKLPKGKIKFILKRFDDKEGNKRLWQPKSARIICDEESFAPLQKYGHSNTERLDPDNDYSNKGTKWWQAEWEKILGGVGRPSDLPYAIRGFIDIHGYDVTGEYVINPCTRGLRTAIKKLITQHPAIKEKLPDYIQNWLKKK